MAKEAVRTEELKRQIKRADELAQAARSSWFVLLGALAYASIAVAGVADRDFFLADVTTELPILGVSVPTVAFFYAAPTILLALYANLHSHVLKLWTALAGLPAVLTVEDSERPTALADALQPWLLVDAAAALKPGSPRPAFSNLAFVLSFTLTWWMGPLVLAGFWFQSWPYHSLVLSLYLAAILAVSLWFGFASFYLGRKRLRRGSATLTPSSGSMTRKAVAFTGLFILLGVVSFAATKRDVPDPPWLGPRTADLYRAEIAKRPTNWIPRKQALGRFLADAKNLSEEQARKDFAEQRNHFLLSFTADDLSGADLRGADLRYAFLPAVLMERADLREARLYSAQLEGALMKAVDLSGAKLNSTELSCARMPGATFDGAVMHSARLHRAELSNAKMRGALLIKSDLSFADISRADLSKATLIETDLSGASLKWANLRGANLALANLANANLHGAIGDADTELPAATVPLATCYRGLGEKDKKSMARSWGLDLADFQKEFVCPDVTPEPTPTPDREEPERCWPLAPGEERGQAQDQTDAEP